MGGGGSMIITGMHAKHRARTRVHRCWRCTWSPSATCTRPGMSAPELSLPHNSATLMTVEPRSTAGWSYLRNGASWRKVGVFLTSFSLINPKRVLIGLAVMDPGGAGHPRGPLLTHLHVHGPGPADVRGIPNSVSLSLSLSLSLAHSRC